MPVEAPDRRRRRARGRRVAAVVWLVLFLLIAAMAVGRLVDHAWPGDPRTPAAGPTVSITELGG